jgi:hypothetical protein
MTFQGRCIKSQGRCKTISGEVPTYPHLPSKSGHVSNLLRFKNPGGLAHWKNIPRKYLEKLIFFDYLPTIPCYHFLPHC